MGVDSSVGLTGPPLLGGRFSRSSEPNTITTPDVSARHLVAGPSLAHDGRRRVAQFGRALDTARALTVSSHAGDGPRADRAPSGPSPRAGRSPVRRRSLFLLDLHELRRTRSPRPGTRGHPVGDLVEHRPIPRNTGTEKETEGHGLLKRSLTRESRGKGDVVDLILNPASPRTLELRAAPSRPLGGQRMGHFCGWPKCYQNGRVLARGQKRTSIPHAELHGTHGHALRGRVSARSLVCVRARSDSCCRSEGGFTPDSG